MFHLASHVRSSEANTFAAIEESTAKPFGSVSLLFFFFNMLMLQVSVLEFVVVAGSPPAGGKGCETQMEVEETASGVSHFLDHVELKQTSKKRKTKIGFPFKGGM